MTRLRVTNRTQIVLNRISNLLCAAMVLVSACALSSNLFAQHRTRPRRVTSPNQTSEETRAKQTSASRKQNAKFIIHTEPRAVVWIDDVRRGVTDENGQLPIYTIAPTPYGSHALHVRASGFAGRTLPLLRRSGTFEIKLAPTKDEAELIFQQAEEANDKAANDDDRARAAELYRRALQLRPRFAEAHLALARVLLASEDSSGALAEVKEARKIRPVYPEASAVEGRALRSAADENAAIAAYRRAIREGRGFQPEAYTGLGIVYDERGNYKEAVIAFQKALAQLSDAEPLVYQLLGATYEKLENYKAAVAAYENYLRLAPNGKLAPAIQSVIDQLRQQAADQQRGGSGAPPPERE